MCACVCTCVLVYAHVCLCVCMHMFLGVCLCTCVSVYACVFVCHTCARVPEMGQNRKGWADGSPPSPALLPSQLPLPSQIEQTQLECIPLSPKSQIQNVLKITGVGHSPGSTAWCPHPSWRGDTWLEWPSSPQVWRPCPCRQDKAHPPWDTRASGGITWGLWAAPPVPFLPSTFHGWHPGQELSTSPHPTGFGTW